MDPSNQDTFLQKLNRALSDVPENLRIPFSSASPEEIDGGRAILDRIQQRSRKDRLLLLEKMTVESRAVNLEITPAKDMDAAWECIRQLVITRQPEEGAARRVVAWKHPLLEGLNLEKRFGEISVPIYFTEFSNPEEKASLREKITQACIGLTSADFCLADSATLVLKTRAGQARSVSLVPPVHVAVIFLEQVLADLNELVALLKYDPVHRAEGLTRCLTFITGPSRTADIEAIMVHGVHGPREVHLLVITG